MILLSKVLKKASTLFYFQGNSLKYPCLIFYFFIIFYFYVIYFGEHKKPLFYDINKYYNDSYISSVFESLDCTDGRPCIYGDPVDFRIIVMTYSRKNSLQRLLEHLKNLDTDNDKVALEIWVDRNDANKINLEVLKYADSFKWNKGTKRVNVQRKHAGIYGQWINTWRPTNKGELALFLEDDMVVSPFVYKWLKNVHKMYGNRTDFAGASLNGGDQLKAHNTLTEFSYANVAFMYVCLGTWGFSPSPTFWAEFQDWYHFLLNRNKIPKLSPPDNCYNGWCPSTYNTSKHNKTRKQNAKFYKTFDLEPNADVTGIESLTGNYFKPYVEGAEPTSWYRKFEISETTETMWEMWFLYFSALHKRFTVYSNINAAFSSRKDLIHALYLHDSEHSLDMDMDMDLCLAINMHEPGLHFGSNSFSTTCVLLQKWFNELDDLPEVLEKFGWSGELLEKV